MHRGRVVLAVMTAGALAMSGIAAADDLVGDALVGDPGTSNVENRTMAEGTEATFAFSALIDETGSASDDVLGGGATVNVTIARSGAWLKAGASGTPSSFTFSAYDTAQTGTVTIAVPPCTPVDTQETMTVVLTAGTSTNGRSLDATKRTETFTYRITAADGDSDCGGAANVAPVVATAAADAHGVEGDTLTTSGAFSDPGDDLTVTADNSLGTFTDNGDGTWSWSYATTDDVPSGTVTVTATDTGGLTATDDFSYSATNADPVLGTVTATQTAACSVDVSATFTDAGSGDTHASTISWGDGDQTVTDPDTSPVTGSHTYTTAGTKTISVSVTDDDGGSDAGTASFAPANTPSAFLAPINTGAGARSVFKLGSTIPVKITVTDCSGALVTSLTPTVQLQKVDAVPDGTVNEAQISETPTNGKAMAWNGEHYQYVLSTKKSQFTGSALPQGTYKLLVTDPSFFSGTVAYFDLR